nr:MAG: L-fucokinase [Bacteriophage sp.]
MGLKKYEIITVGSDKRVRALRSWQVGDRYVNIGDVGGIVYNEKTLSQDGACWLFRGNFGFPGARIGGDSIVDVGETTLSSTGTPNVDILGSSVVVGSKLVFASDQTAANAVVLTTADFEQGGFGYSNPIGTNWERWKVSGPNYVRTVKPIFAGGAPTTLMLDVPGYKLNWFTLDRDGNVIATGRDIISGEGITTVVPACHSFVFRLAKDPSAAIVPADATAAKITFTGTYETKLSIIDSRVEINPATSTGTSSIKPGGTYTIASGAKYPEAIIRNSKVSINILASTGRTFRIMGQIIGSNATLDGTTGGLAVAGSYSNVKNLTASGALASGTGTGAYSVIQATDCDNMVVSPTVFPGLAAAQSDNMPFIFRGCNVPNGIFYHRAQIANTYKNIDFAKASADLGKAVPADSSLASSEVEGMYRVVAPASGTIGALVESHESIKSLVVSSTANSYGTTIYKDAYLNGIFDLAGTNVFGNKVRSHPLAQVLNVQPRAVQGQVNATSTGQTITGVVPNEGRVTVPKPFRINSSKGLSLAGIPSGVEAIIFFTTLQGVITGLATSTGSTYGVVAPKLLECMAYVTFRKADGGSLEPADLAGVTVTVYNGCKIVNTRATAVSMKGNIHVEDNATLINASVVGAGYFGGNAVMSGMSVNGYACMKDNTLCTGTSENVQTFASLVMEGNAVYNSIASLVLSGLKVHMYDNSKVLGELRTVAPTLIMRDNATITAAGNLSGACVGIVTIKDNAAINTSISTIGDITLCGDYVSTSIKTWTGKRVIDNHNAPEYENNVKTQYDF